MRLLILFIFISSLLLAQNKKILKPGATSQPFKKLQKLNLEPAKNNSYNNNPSKVTGLMDTLEYRSTGALTTHFGFDPQDIMVQWFIAPADMTIKAAGFNSVLNDGDTLQTASLKLIKLRWTADQIRGGVDGIPEPPVQWGYYPASGNGYYDRAAFPTDSMVSGDWVAVTSPDSGIFPHPFGEELWSDEGVGADIVPENKGSFNGDYQWVEMNKLGFEPNVLWGEIFAVVLKNTSTNIYSEDNWTIQAGKGIPYPGFKYYGHGRLVTDPESPDYDGGWWSRAWTWDIAVAVDISTGGQRIEINILGIQSGTLNTGPQTINATVIPGIPVGPFEVYLYYSTNDDENWQKIEMIHMGEDIYSADIPGQSPGTIVTYFVSAVETNNGSVSTSYEQRYVIFQSIHNTLLVFNGYTTATGYPQSYYFGQDDFENYYTLGFDHDVWAYSALTGELVNNYTNIIEITSNSPNHVNDDIIAAWLDADASHNYALAGDEYLGNLYGWPSEAQDIPAEDFANAIMGVETYIDDIVLFGSTGPSHFITVEGSTLGDALHQKVSEVGTDRDSLMYDPNWEIGVANWLDGIESAEDCEAFLKADTGGVVYTIGHSRTLAAGNKIAFFAYDPLSLNAKGSEYYWYGFSEAAPQVQLLKWFGIDYVVGIEEKDVEKMPESFSLKQNYPNPFNPNTVISYQLSMKGDVKLLVHDVLGREVQTLVNKKQPAGEYKVTFDASGLASGIYYYRLFIRPVSLSLSKGLSQTRKMLLLR